jgi:hypothetical protein
MVVMKLFIKLLGGIIPWTYAYRDYLGEPMLGQY